MKESEILKFIVELNQPVVTEYELRLLIYKLYKNELQRGIKKKIDKSIAHLEDVGIIEKDTQYTGCNVFKIEGKKGFDAGDAACSIDPFCYVSHLSAMEFHGLTDRIPKVLYITSPTLTKWNAFAKDKMMKEISREKINIESLGLVKLKKIEIDRINSKPVIYYSGIHQGAFKKIDDRPLRVSNIGRTFLDMVRKPDYCGGIHHVIDVFKEYGGTYQKAIIEHIDRDKNGKKIEKARAGYLLEEFCKVSDPCLDKWAKNVTRGGSNKLDPKVEYCEIYSERWCISLNV